MGLSSLETSVSLGLGNHPGGLARSEASHAAVVSVCWERKMDGYEFNLQHVDAIDLAEEGRRRENVVGIKKRWTDSRGSW